MTKIMMMTKKSCSFYSDLFAYLFQHSKTLSNKNTDLQGWRVEDCLIVILKSVDFPFKSSKVLRQAVP